AMMTRAPSATNASAKPRPIPRAPPVMRAILLLSLISGSSGWQLTLLFRKAPPSLTTRSRAGPLDSAFERTLLRVARAHHVALDLTLRSFKGRLDSLLAGKCRADRLADEGSD